MRCPRHNVLRRRSGARPDGEPAVLPKLERCVRQIVRIEGSAADKQAVSLVAFTGEEQDFRFESIIAFRCGCGLIRQHRWPCRDMPTRSYRNEVRFAGKQTRAV